jgi:hypothetical protein
MRKEENPLTGQPVPKAKPVRERSTVPLWNRFLFRLWLVFHPKHKNSHS